MTNSIWGIDYFGSPQGFPSFKAQYKGLSETSQGIIDRLFQDIVVMDEPQLHDAVIACPHIPEAYYPVQYVVGPVSVIVSLEEYDQGVAIERVIIPMFCAELTQP